MNFYHRSKRYVLRQRGKTLILGSLLFVSLIVCLSAIIILRVTDSMVETIAKNSNASVGLFAIDFTNAISPESVNELETLENVREAKKSNQLNATLNDYFYVGLEDPIFGADVRLSGNDDLTMTGPFFLQTKRLIEGDLHLQDHEILIEDGFAQVNNLFIGDTIPLATGDGDAVIEATIAGTFQLSEMTPRHGGFIMYTTTTLINELQGYQGYAAVSFLITNPEEITQTKSEMTTRLTNPNYDWNLSDALFRSMRASLDGVSGLVRLMLRITVMTSILIVSLLLSLWMRERRKEAALLLVVGEPKALIIGQRLLEVFSIYLLAFLLAIPILIVVIPQIGSLVVGMQDVENSEFYLTLKDALLTFAIGGITLLIGMVTSLITMMRSTPKSILSTID